MPQVPRLRGPQVEAQALPNARLNTSAPIEAFGGGQAARGFDAAQGLSNQVFQIAQEEKQKADDLATTEAFTNLVQQKQKLMYDQNSGVMTRRGKDAFGVVDEYGTQFDKAADDIENGLYNDTQKAMFRKMRQRERVDFDGFLQRHTLNERMRFDDEQTQSALKTVQDEAVLNFSDPGKIQDSIKDQELLIKANAARLGKPPELVDQQLKEARSQTFAGVISRHLANGDDRTASAIFKEVKSEMTADHAVALEKALEEGSLRGESQRLSDSIISKHGSLTSAIAAVKDQIDDPKLRDATMDRVRQEFTLREAAKRDREERDFLSATNILEQGGSYDQIPAEVISRMPLSQRTALRNYAKGADPVTDLPTYYNLKTQAATPELRDKFLTTNLLDYAGKFSRSDLKEMMDLQAGMRKGDSGAEKHLDGFRSDSQIVNDSLKEAGIKDEEEKALFMRKADEAAAIRARQTGKRPTNEEMQAIVDGLLVKGVTDKGWIWDSKKRAYELQPGESFQVEANQVPRLERMRIEEALKRAGKPITDAAIAELYSRKLRK